jgi:hypothetical protein
MSAKNRIVGWFYNHLARLIYAQATSWAPTNLVFGDSRCSVARRRAAALDGIDFGHRHLVESRRAYGETDSR